MKKAIMASIISCLIFTALPICAKTLNLCVDERNWYPFTFQKEKQAGGMHVDVVKKAFESLGYQVKIQAFPRNRCIYYLQNYKKDAMISVSYNPKLAESIQYPPESANNQESKWRIMQVDHMVITHIDSQYEFEGDIKTLPMPIRLPFGEALATDLENAGLKVDMAKEARNNFRKLMRDKTGVVITTSVMAEEMNKQFEFKNKFIISPTPLASKSYFLAFSKKSAVSDDEKKKIWEEIARWRDDYLFMLQIFAQY